MTLLFLVISFLGFQPALLQQIVVPTDWSVQSGKLPIIVSTGTKEAKDIKAMGTFVENSTKYSLDGQPIVLCADQECRPGITIPANTTITLYLHYKGSTVHPGTYSGSLSISSDGEPANTPVPLTLYVSSRDSFWGGVVVVVLGGLLAWLVKVFATNRITRDQALLPISIMFERLTALAANLKRADSALTAQTPKLSGAINDWLDKMEILSLETKYGLPPRTPFALIANPTISVNYATFVSEAEKAVALLTVFINEGVDKVVKLALVGQIPSPAAKAAIKSIDDLYSSDLTVEMARSKIQELIPISHAEAGGQPEIQPPPSKRLLFEIHTLNFAVWLVVLLAAAIGTIMTVVMKPGFGKLYDFLLCFTTSFGIPTVSNLAIPSRAAVSGAAQETSGSKGLVGL